MPETTAWTPSRHCSRPACSSLAAEYISYPAAGSEAGMVGTDYRRVCTPCANAVPDLLTRRPLAGVTGANLIAEVERLTAEVEQLRARVAGDQPWSEAVDWLLNSCHTADPDIQDAFWGMADGVCTREEADRGFMADGRTIGEAREEADRS